MKTTLLLLLSLTLSVHSFSQKKIDVQESNESFSTGNQNALSVIIYGAELGDVEKAWKKQLKDMKGDVKAKKEIYADDCMIKKMSENTFDVYSRLEEVEGGVRLVAAYDLGGAYLSSGEHKDMFPFVKAMMYSFGVKETKSAIGEELKTQQKTLDGLNKEQEGLEKDVEGMTKEIEEYKKKIEENEKSIEETKKEIETKKEEVKAQEAVVKEVESKQKAVK